VLETGTFRRLGDTKEITVDVRFIFATNKNIEEEILSGRFRRDLFYRLNTFIINVPPLRERKEDIPLLVEYFLRTRVRKNERKTVSERALEALLSYEWPGNVRELFNVLERAVLVSGNREEIDVDDLPLSLLASRNNKSEMVDLSCGTGLNLKELQKRHVERVLELTKGNKTKASRILGISRKKLYRLIKENGN
jgi:transcriptional regulator with PAS, ATPase and Fis domain